LSGSPDMTPHQYRAALAKLGISQVRVAQLMGADPRTSRSWALGQNRIPPPVAILLRLMLIGRITVQDIEAVF